VRAPHELSTAFRAIGLKVTPQRQVLFRLLHDNESHPSAEALHLAASAVMPGISLRTVYQTLNDLVAMGELQQLQLSSGSARFDPNVDDHHHVVCDRCGAVRDVYVSGLDAISPDTSGLDGFHISTADLVFRGTCATCAPGAGGHRPITSPSTETTTPSQRNPS
jgi:Fe2+ or Zn2+ uptake regulation protein